MPRTIELSRKAISALKKDARVKELFYNYNINGELNTVETIILNQLVSEAERGEL